MAQKITTPEGEAFAAKLHELLSELRPPVPERGRGAWLMAKYHRSNATVSYWLNGQGKPGPALVRKMASDFRVEYDWLYFNRGLKRKSGTPSEVGVTDGIASAGDGHDNHNVRMIGSIYFRPGSLERKGINPDNCETHYIEGVSMQPRLQDGDVVLYDKAATAVEQGAIYVLDRPGLDGKIKTVVKRLYTDGDVLEIVSDNRNDPKYSLPLRIPLGTPGLVIIGRVRWIGSWED